MDKIKMKNPPSNPHMTHNTWDAWLRHDGKCNGTHLPLFENPDSDFAQ